MLNEFPKMNLEDNETGCCPRFHVEDWDNQYIELKDELFVNSTSKTLFHFPLNLGKVMKQTQELIIESGAVDEERYVILSFDSTPFKTEHLFKVTKDVRGLESVKLNGRFFMKVFDGEYKEVPYFIKRMEEIEEEKEESFKKIYTFYTTCPKCAKHYGHNYIVMIAEI